MVSHLAIERDGEPIASGRMVHVFVDVDAQTKIEIPAWVREAVQPWSAPPAGAAHGPGVATAGQQG